MSGSGRKSQYRKKVTNDFLSSEIIPTDDQEIVKVKSSRGTNIFEIEDTNGNVELALMPNKFKKLIWIKRGDFLIVSHADDLSVNNDGSSIKVRYLILHILNKDHIRHLKNVNKWPHQYDIQDDRKCNAHDDLPIKSSDKYMNDRMCITDDNEDDDDEDDERPVDAMGNTIEDPFESDNDNDEAIS